MKIIENVTIYKCEYCGKELKRKYAMIKHEYMCFNNPKNQRACFHCGKLIKKEAVIYSGYDDYCGEPTNVKREFFFCNHKKIFLYTPQNEFKNNFNHIDENGDYFKNNPMPKECEGHRSF